ncbi:MAG: hypothetical protein V4481_03730 [Patescibacteria group bacterium]
MADIIAVDFSSPLLPNRNDQPKMRPRVFFNELQNALTPHGINLVPEIRLMAILSSLGGPRSSAESISTHRQGLIGYSLERLQEIAENASEQAVALNPAYYHALVAEIWAKGGREST